jgi:hypothetical protein
MEVLRAKRPLTCPDPPPLVGRASRAAFAYPRTVCIEWLFAISFRQERRHPENQRRAIVGCLLKKSIACCRDLIEASVALESRLSLRAAPDTMLL